MLRASDPLTTPAKEMELVSMSRHQRQMPLVHAPRVTSCVRMLVCLWLQHSSKPCSKPYFTNLDNIVPKWANFEGVRAATTQVDVFSHPSEYDRAGRHPACSRRREKWFIRANRGHCSLSYCSVHYSLPLPQCRQTPNCFRHLHQQGRCLTTGSALARTLVATVDTQLALPPLLDLARPIGLVSRTGYNSSPGARQPSTPRSRPRAIETGPS